MPFETIKDYLKNKGKAVQILSSKFVASKLYKEPPKQESVAVQATEDVVFQDSIQDLQFNIEVLNGMVEKREAQNKTLLSQFEESVAKFSLEKLKMKDTITNLQVELENAEFEIKELEEMLQNKRRIAYNLEEELRKVTQEKDRTILHLKVDLENANNSVEEKQMIINRLKAWRTPRRNSKGEIEEVDEKVPEVIFYPRKKKEIHEEKPKVAKKTIACQTAFKDQTPKINIMQESVQTDQIVQEPQIIIKEVEAKFCENCRKRESSFHIKNKKSSNNVGSIIDKKKIDVLDDTSSNTSLSPEIRSKRSLSKKPKIDLKSVNRDQSPVKSSSNKNVNSKNNRRSFTTSKKDVRSKNLKELGRIAEENADGNFESYDAKARSLLSKYQNRFHKTGDIRNKGQMVSPKVVFTRNFSTPMVEREIKYETVYYANTQSGSYSIDIQKQQIRDFYPVLRKNRSAEK